MQPAYDETSVSAKARRAFADAQAELDDLEQAYAEEIIEVTVRSRTLTIVIPVSVEIGKRLSDHLLEFCNDRVIRLYQRFLETIELDGKDAAIELANHFKRRA